MERDFELVDGTQLDDAEVLSVLRDGYGRPFHADWLDWKHRQGPWGASRCVVAQDGDGPLGVVFGLPWRFSVDGAEVDGIRLVDGATTPRSIRRGVFRAICKELVEPAEGLHPEMVIATATPEAQGAHVKNGAIALEPMEWAYRPTGYGRAGVVTDEAVLDAYVVPLASPKITSRWDPASLRWRLDGRFGSRYSVSQLVEANRDHGVVHRTESRKGARVLVVTTTWGLDREVRQLLRALAWKERALAIFCPVGEGTATAKPAGALRRGSSLLCVWDRGEASRQSGHRDGWSLDGLELEGYI